MGTEIDLTRFGLGGVFCPRGTVMSFRVESRSPPLFLFGERHTVKPFILANLLNAIDLAGLGAVACVGTEGIRTSFSRDTELADLHHTLACRHGADTAAILSDLLEWLKGPDLYFTRLLPLVLPTTVIESVDDPTLVSRARQREAWHQIRIDHIGHVLRESRLFEPGPDGDNREAAIHLKARMQYEYEWAEDAVNIERDGRLVVNMLNLWDRAGRDRAAILNAGSSHQYRIARLLPPDVNYYHVEQP
jgi:hypothetical protein